MLISVVNASPQSGHAMASLGGDQVLLFGGWYDDLLGDTWLAIGFLISSYRTYLPVVVK